MENMDALQEWAENVCRLCRALIPFVPHNRQDTLTQFYTSLEPMTKIKDIYRTFEMIKAMQQAMNGTGDEGPDLSKLSGILSPEQLQMFEMFRSMQDMDLT